MMERFFCYLVNTLCCGLYRKAHRKYAAITDVEQVQKEVLLRILTSNSDCEYGRRYGFCDIKDIEAFEKRVPLTTYDDYIEDIAKLQETGENPLFCEPVVLLEITSGSTSASKLVPYNRSLKREFQMGLKPWIYDLYTNCNGVKWGKSYWSITPATLQKSYTKSGIPIGFEDDSAYFGGLEQKLQNSVFAVPSRVARLSDMDEFYSETAFHLLICKKLTLVSVWNPTYFLLLLEYMGHNAERLVSRIMERNRKRGEEVRNALNDKAYERLWKHLKVISCWCDAHAGPYAKKLAELFPKVYLQPKGLLATEGFVSFPFVNEEGARLSVYSHFFEFQDIETQEILPANKLAAGRQYTVIITTSGGLYRYQLKDIIKVVGFAGVIPLMKFMGKMDRVSDLFGEKLSEGFVERIFDRLGIISDFTFAMIAPEVDHYVLYIRSDSLPTGVEEALRENFHYDYCRKLGQLKELRIFKLTGNPEQEYIAACVFRGMRLGDIKPVLLYLHGGLENFFRGEYV